MTTITTDQAAEYGYQTMPEDQGQMVEVSYAVDWERQILICRTCDRSDRTTVYDVADLADDPDDLEVFEPWNGDLPAHGDWTRIEDDLG